MRFEIGQSAADIGVILSTLRGTHPPVRSSVLTSAAVALVVLGVIPSLVRQTADTSSFEDRAFGVGMVLFMLAFGAGLVVRSLAKFEVSEEGVSKKSPLRWLSWTVHRADIHQIAIELNQGWALVITTTASKRRALPLEGSLRQALSKLYPEVAPFEPTARDIRRWKWLAGALGVVVVAVAVMLWWLGRLGLVSW